jgi:multiple sugar transport system permease protein
MSSSSPASKEPRRIPTARRRFGTNTKRWMPYLFISPFFILFAIFGIFPLLFSAYVSFFRWDPIGGLSGMKWEGLGNYAYVLQLDGIDLSKFFTTAFWQDLYERNFWRALYNTLWIGVVAGLTQHLVAIPLAFFIHTRLRKLRNAVLGLYFLPFITNTVAIVLVFQALFSKDFGVFNSVMNTLGNWQIGGASPMSWLFPQEPVDWGRPEKTKWIVAFVVWWRYVGWNTVLYMSALQTIPADLYEAARVDGASTWKQFRYITLPMLRPMMFFAVTLTLIGSLQLFEEPFVLTGGTGGVGQAAETSAMYMLKVGMTDGDFGTASAIAWLLFMVVAAMTWLNHRVLKPKE